MTIQKAKKGYVIGVILGVFVSALLYFIQPVRWEGRALIRFGHISSNKLVEEVSTTAERIRLYSFIDAVADRANRDGVAELLDDDRGAGLIFKPIRNTDTAIIGISSNSKELTQIAIESVVEEILFEHNKILAIYAGPTKSQLLNHKSTVGFNFDSKKDRLSSAENLVMQKLTELEYKLHELDSKMSRVFSLKTEDNISYITQTALAQPISIGPKRLLTSLWRACLLGALIGAILAAMWVHWARLILRRYFS